MGRLNIVAPATARMPLKPSRALHWLAVALDDATRKVTLERGVAPITQRRPGDELLTRFRQAVP